MAGAPKSESDNYSDEETARRRDALLLRLLKTPPQPRPKRERDKEAKPTRKRQEG